MLRRDPCKLHLICSSLPWEDTIYDSHVSCPCRHLHGSISLALDARMNMSDKYWKCFRSTQSNKYHPARRSRLLDFNLVTRAFKKAARKPESYIFQRLVQIFIHWLSFGAHASKQNRLELILLWLNCHPFLRQETSSILHGRNAPCSSEPFSLLFSKLLTVW